MEPLISVIIPVYNASAYIQDALDSVLLQDVPLDIYVIDDNSSDNLSDALAPYLDLDFLHIIHNTSNLGAAASRNKGVELCNSKYIAFLDADDWWIEDKLRNQLNILEESGAVICSTARELVNAEGHSLNRIIPIDSDIDYLSLLRHNSLSCSAILALREVLLEFPMEHEDSHEDYITWLKIVKKYGPAKGIDTPYLKYRLSSNSKSGSKWKSARMTYKAYRYMGFPILKSLFYFTSYAFHGVLKYYFAPKK